MRTIGILFLLGYAALMATDFRLAPRARTQIPATVRSSPGGYRSWSFWHSGEHGGK